MTSHTTEQVLLIGLERLDPDPFNPVSLRTNVRMWALEIKENPHYPAGGVRTDQPLDGEMTRVGQSHHIAAAYDKTKNEVSIAFTGHDSNPDKKLNSLGSKIYRVGKYLANVGLSDALKANEKDPKLPNLPAPSQFAIDAPSILIHNSNLNVAVLTLALEYVQLTDSTENDIARKDVFKSRLDRLVDTVGVGLQWKSTDCADNRQKPYFDSRSPKIYHPDEFSDHKYVYCIQLKTTGELYLGSMTTSQFTNIMKDPVQWSSVKIGGSFVLPRKGLQDRHSALPEMLMLQDQTTKTYNLYIFLALDDGSFCSFFVRLRPDGSIIGQGEIGGSNWDPSPIKNADIKSGESWKNSITALTWAGRVWLFIGYGNRCRILSTEIPNNGVLPSRIGDWTEGGDIGLASNTDDNNLIAYTAVKVPSSFVA